ncbi:MAG: formyltransferase family protein [Bdellovibrionota bacterium]|nr:formyltransferase family protein [Bdellovibrionota bacterium]
MVEDKKFAYLGFGRAGKECLEILLELGAPKENILVITYEHSENEIFLSFLQENEISFSVKCIKEESTFLHIKEFSPDLMLSIHFRDIIPKKILELSKNPGINLHPSLLPLYSGCLATMWVIINGDTKTGVTYHYMTPKVDEGNILIQKEITIDDKATGESMFNYAIDVGVAHFKEALFLALDNHEGTKQEGERTYYSRDIPFRGLIDPHWSNERVERFIRAFVFEGKPYAKLSVKGQLMEVPTFERYLELKATL